MYDVAETCVVHTLVHLASKPESECMILIFLSHGCYCLTQVNNIVLTALHVIDFEPFFYSCVWKKVQL